MQARLPVLSTFLGHSKPANTYWYLSAVPELLALAAERRETTQIYVHADMSIKERALARTAPPNTTPGRYQPPDSLLAFLTSL